MINFKVEFDNEDVKKINETYYDCMNNFTVLEYNKPIGEILGNKVFARIVFDGRYGANVREQAPVVEGVKEILI